MYREAGTVPRVVRTIDLDLLSSSIQLRIRRVILGDGVPELIAKEFRDDRLPWLNTSWRCLLLAFGAAGAEANLWFSHFGDLYGEGWAIQPPAFAIYHGIALGLLALSMLALVYTQRDTEASPLPCGKYLFPQQLVEVKGRWLVVTSLETLRDVDATNSLGPEMTLNFADGGHESLRLDAKTNLQRVVEHARIAIAKANPHRNDPFVELHGAEIDTFPGKDPAPKRALGVMLLLSTLVAVYCAPKVWAQHNALSDAMMLQKVRALTYANDDAFDEAARQYEHTSAQHNDDLEQMRHVRAQLNVPNGLAYLRSSKERREKTGSGHPYEKEVDDAVFSKLYSVNDAAKLIGEYLEIGGAHDVPLRERALVLADPSWQAAVERNNIKAFAELRRNSPGTALDRHAETEIHARYQQVHNQWLRYSWRNLSMRLLVADLINALDERRDPRVILEVRAAEPEGLKHVDAEHAQSVGKNYQPAAPHLTPKVVEKLLSESMIEHAKGHFQTFFVNDIDFVATTKNDELPRIVMAVEVQAAKEKLFVVPKTGEQLADVRLRYTLRLEVPGKSPTTAVERISREERQEVFEFFTEAYPLKQFKLKGEWLQVLYGKIVESAWGTMKDDLRSAM